MEKNNEKVMESLSFFIFIIFNALASLNHSSCRFKDTLMNTVGNRTTEMALELGLLYSPSEALKIGMVDQLVPEDQVLTTATEAMTKWLAVPGIRHVL